MIITSTDNEFIYSFLEKKMQLPLAFETDKVYDFDDKDDYCLIIYISSCRNFIFFKIENYLQDNNSFLELMEAIQEFSNKEFSIVLKNQTCRLVENKLHSKNNSRFFFDAH